LGASASLASFSQLAALVTQNDKNSHTTLVYETPEPRQEVAQQQQQPQPKKE
jgi:hypothetical protein